MTTYRIAPRGVTEVETGLLVLPDHPHWPLYLTWLLCGNSPLPMTPPPPPVPTAEEIAAEAEHGARKAAREALRADATVTFLRTHTPVEAAAWVNANVTNLTQAKDVLAKLAMIVAYLARERLSVAETVVSVDKPMPQ